LPEVSDVKRLALLALLLASSSLVAAPAPLQKTHRKAERLAARQDAAGDRAEVEVVVVNLGFVGQIGANVVIGAAPQAPAQPRNADPPG
jgi:hypothetical protein